MEARNPGPKGELKPKPPKWSSPIWYLPVMFLLLWFWQSTVSQFSYRTIPYSEFKASLARHEVVSCVVRDDDIQGEILPKTPVATAQLSSQIKTNANAKTAAAANNQKSFRRRRLCILIFSSCLIEPTPLRFVLMVHSCAVLPRSGWTKSSAVFLFPSLNCQHKVNSKSTKPCYHACTAGIFTVLKP